MVCKTWKYFILVLRQLNIDSHKVSSCKNLVLGEKKLDRVSFASNIISFYFQVLWVHNYIIWVYKFRLSSDYISVLQKLGLAVFGNEIPHLNLQWFKFLCLKD